MARVDECHFQRTQIACSFFPPHLCFPQEVSRNNAPSSRPLFVPDVRQCAQPLPPEQKLPVAVQPFPELLPPPDQRLVSDLDRLFPAVRVPTRYQQAGVGQLLRQRRGLRRQLLQVDPPLRVLGALLRAGHPHQPHEHGAHNILLIGVEARKGAVGALGDRAPHLADRFVGGVGDKPSGVCRAQARSARTPAAADRPAHPDRLQDALDQPLFEVAARPERGLSIAARRSAAVIGSTLTKPRSIVPQPLVGQDAAEEVRRAASGSPSARAFRPPAGASRKMPPAARVAAQRERLLELVGDQHEPRQVGALLAQLRQHVADGHGARSQCSASLRVSARRSTGESPAPGGPPGAGPGCEGGRRRDGRHPSPTPAAGQAPRSAGISPARTSDDLPQPDGPTTATKFVSRSRASSFSTIASRPK